MFLRISLLSFGNGSRFWFKWKASPHKAVWYPTYSGVDETRLASLCVHIMGLLEYGAHGHLHCHVFTEGRGTADAHLANIVFAHAHAPLLHQISLTKPKFKGEIKKVKKVTAGHWTKVPDLCEYERLCNYTDPTPWKQAPGGHFFLCFNIY